MGFFSLLNLTLGFLCDFTAFFAADFLAAGVFAAEDILSNKKGCWQGYGFFLKKY
jgi:hypothetical protein